MTRSSSSSSFSRLRLVGSGALVAAGSIALAVAAPTAASAHVTAAASSTAAGSYTVVTFSLAHGCEGSPTTGLTITMPDGINSVSPTINPNWDVVKNEVAIADPVTDSHGNTATERVSDVVYTAKTPLADGYRDTVALQLQLPEDAAGSTLEFPVLQTCETGSTAWDQPTVDGQDEPELPAPTVAVTAAEAGSGHGADTTTTATVTTRSRPLPRRRRPRAATTCSPASSESAGSSSARSAWPSGSPPAAADPGRRRDPSEGPRRRYRDRAARFDRGGGARERAQLPRLDDSRCGLDRDGAAGNAGADDERRPARPRDRRNGGGSARRRAGRLYYGDGCVSVVGPEASMPLELGAAGSTR